MSNSETTGSHDEQRTALSLEIPGYHEAIALPIE
jgi:hypothetical protein